MLMMVSLVEGCDLFAGRKAQKRCAARRRFCQPQAAGRGVGLDGDEPRAARPRRIRRRLKLMPEPGAGKAYAVPCEEHGDRIIAAADGGPGLLEALEIGERGERC